METFANTIYDRAIDTETELALNLRQPRTLRALQVWQKRNTALLRLRARTRAKGRAGPLCPREATSRSAFERAAHRCVTGMAESASLHAWLTKLLI